MRKGAKWFIVLVVFIVLLIPAYFIAQTYGIFQKEKVLSDYALAVDVDGESYNALPLVNGFAAMDKQGPDRQLYYRVDMSHIQYLFQLAYGEYAIETGGDNPYLAGRVDYEISQTDYVRSENQYKNANDYDTVLNFYDRDNRPIYMYRQTGKGDGDLVKSIIHQGMTRTHNGGSEPARDPYLNITALFRDKLGINVNLEVDEEQKIVTIHMKPMEENKQ
ncbi:hypothetical protein [Paenibacillus hubeiensis]|uniref:hypothetical protein n=1 Tax=Paenibacillus hubeiensis TaxID=3077330 RepID=UPI0031BA977A